MKTNKKVWKIVSVLLVLTMIVGLLPGGFLDFSQEVDAVVEATETPTTILTEDFENSDTTYYEGLAVSYKELSDASFTVTDSTKAVNWQLRSSNATPYANVELSDEWDSDGDGSGKSLKFTTTKTTYDSNYYTYLTRISSDFLSDDAKAALEAGTTIALDSVTMSYDFKLESTVSVSTSNMHPTASALFGRAATATGGTTLWSNATAGLGTPATYYNALYYLSSVTNGHNFYLLPTAWYIGSTDTSYTTAIENGTYSSSSTGTATNQTFECNVNYDSVVEEDGVITTTGSADFKGTLYYIDGAYYVGVTIRYLSPGNTVYIDNIQVDYNVTTEKHSEQTEWYNVITPYSQELLEEKYAEGTIDTTLYSTTVDTALFADGKVSSSGGLAEDDTRAYDDEDYDVGSFENADDWTCWHTGSGTDQSLAINSWYGGGSGYYKAHYGNSMTHAYFTTVAALAAGDYQANVKTYVSSTSSTQVYVVAKLDIDETTGLGDGKYEVTDEGYSILGEITTQQTNGQLKYCTVDDNSTGNVLFDISEDYEECVIGLLVVSPNTGYGELDDFFLIGPDNSSLIKEDDNSYLEQEDWYNLVTPYSDSVLESAAEDGTISTTTYSRDVDAALVGGDYDDGTSSNYSIGSFENATYWKTTGTHSGDLNKAYDLSTNSWFTGYSGGSVAYWGYGAAGSTVLFYTTVDAMAAGYYQANVKGIGENAAIYLVADLGVDETTGLGDGQYELTDEGYSILATLNSEAKSGSFRGTIDSANTAETFKYFSVSGNSSGNAVFKLSEDYTNVRIGIYVVETTDSSWGYLDDFFLIGPDNSNVFVPLVYYIDDVSNGDFETGLDTDWNVEEYSGSDVAVEITEEQYNELSDYNVWELDGKYYIWMMGGYTIDYTGRNGSTSTTVEVDNTALKWEAVGETVQNYQLQMYQVIQMTEAGEYKIKVDTMGRWSEDEFMISVYEFEYDPEAEIKEEGGDLLMYSVPTTGSFAGFTENISEESFEVTEGQFIVVRITINLDGVSDYGDLTDDSLVFDNIHIVSADYEGDGYDVIHSTDQFSDAFTTYYLSNYWQFDTANIDSMTADSNNCLYYGDWDYGYSFVWDDTRENDYYYFNAYANTSEEFTFTLTQYIDFTKSAKYKLQADLQGILSDDRYAAADNVGLTVTAYEVDADGNIDYDSVRWTGTVSADDITNDGMVTTTIGYDDEGTILAIEVSEGETLAFVISCTLSGFNYTSGTNEVNAHINIDNIKLQAYTAREAEVDDLGYEGVAYASSSGSSILVNGGNLIKGVDISSIISIENSGVAFVDEDGNEADIFEILADAGVNYIRVRVWDDPYDTDGNNYGGGINDVDTAVAIAERAAKAGLSLYVDFMCSDSWADPSRQLSPKACLSMSASEKAEYLASFINSSLTKIEATGVVIGIVSIGNEITCYDSDTSSYTFMGETGDGYATLLSAGADAVRAFDSDILIALHVAGSGGGYVSYYARYFEDIDYDIYAASYYPYNTSYTLDGSMDTLISELNSVAANYNKLTLIAEYNWPFTQTDIDGYEDGVMTNTTQYSYSGLYCTLNSAAVASGFSYTDALAYYKEKGYVDDDGNVSAEGQYYAISDILSNTATNITNCIGSFYWEAAWVDVTNTEYVADGVAYASREAKWKAFGSGVATAAAKSYLGWGSDSAGSAADTYALFQTDATATTSDGKVKASLNTFTLTTTGDDGTETSTTEYAVNAFGITGDDKNTPIDIAQAQVQVISSTDTKYAFRLVGEVNRTNMEDVGFRVFCYDSEGNMGGTGYADKLTYTLYGSITANGETITPDTTNGWEYFYAYTYRNIPTGSIYYFEVRSNSNDVDYLTYFQRASKVYAVLDGQVMVIDSSQIGTLTEADFAE